MLYRLRLRLDAFHVPTETWHTHETQWAGIKAVSRRNALDKGLRAVMAWPGYADRANHADWRVDAEAAIVEEGWK